MSDADESSAQREASANGVTTTYHESENERLLTFELAEQRVVVAQNRRGYAMLSVRTGPEGEELERYYGLDMALDHVAALLGVSPYDLPVPEDGADMGM